MAKNHNKYPKDKPWDNEDIDRWKVDEWTKDDKLEGPLMEEFVRDFVSKVPREVFTRGRW